MIVLVFMTPQSPNLVLGNQLHRISFAETIYFAFIQIFYKFPLPERNQNMNIGICLQHISKIYIESKLTLNLKLTVYFVF